MHSKWWLIVLCETNRFGEKYTVSPGGNKPLCVFYQTCVEKNPTQVWLFPHICAIKHTCVVKATQLDPG